MAITTLDAAIAGFKPPLLPTIKSGSTMATVNAMRLQSMAYTAGIPGAATAPTPGVNGAVVTPATFNGALTRNNPTGGQSAYLAKVVGGVSQVGALLVVDRLWHNSGLNPTLTTSQAITPVAIPARDRNGAALGEGVLAALEWSVAGGAGTPTVTITYTNQAGVSGRTGTLTAITTPALGTVEVFNLQAGDTGVRSVEAYIASATRTSGTFHLVLFRPLAVLPIPAAGASFDLDPLTGGMPRIYDDAALQVLLQPSATTGASVSCYLTETQG